MMVNFHSKKLEHPIEMLFFYALFSSLFSTFFCCTFPYNSVPVNAAIDVKNIDTPDQSNVVHFTA
jgi:hypothetical protein